MEKWISPTIESVLTQEGDFEIEYIVVIDKSSDATLTIVQEYADRVSAGTYPVRCRSVQMHIIEPEKQSGMYTALTTGFSRATGDVYAWLAADDLYRPGGLAAIATVFAAFPHIEWLKGTSGVIDEEGKELYPGSAKLYQQSWIRAGIYGMEAYHIEQDSVFWRAELWKKVGAFPEHFRSMGDYWLWLQFSKYARLWTLETPVSYFRKRADQDSKVYAERCRHSMWEARGNRRPLLAWLARLYFYPYYHIPLIPRAIWEKAYFICFPFHTRLYISLENGTPTIQHASSFSIPYRKDSQDKK